jgi:hypothetical protein
MRIFVLRWSRSVVQSFLDRIDYSEEDLPGNKDVEQHQVICNMLRVFYIRYHFFHFACLQMLQLRRDNSLLLSTGSHIEP